MTAGGTVRRGTGWTCWTWWRACWSWTARTKRPVFAFADFGDQFVCFFGFAFRTNGVGFFTKTQRNHFKLLFAFIAFKFVNRHICAFLAFYFNLKIKKENVNASGMFCPELFMWNCSLTCRRDLSILQRNVINYFRNSIVLMKGRHER